MDEFNKYKRMKISEGMEEDGIKDDEIESKRPFFSFEEEYKQKYSDVKTSIKEDW